MISRKGNGRGEEGKQRGGGGRKRNMNEGRREGSGKKGQEREEGEGSILEVIRAQGRKISHSH